MNVIKLITKPEQEGLAIAIKHYSYLIKCQKSKKEKMNVTVMSVL